MKKINSNKYQNMSDLIKRYTPWGRKILLIMSGILKRGIAW